MIDFLVAFAWRLPLCVVGLSIGEWWVHKYVLHNRWIYKHIPVLSYIYRDHHIDHHFGGHNDLRPHIHLAFIDYWIAWPFIGIGVYRWIVFGKVDGLAGAIALSLVCVTHLVFWNALHRAIHGLDQNWVTRMPGFGLFAHHHLGHHRNPKSNFGVVCIWTDRWMGTRRRRSDVAKTPSVGNNTVNSVRR